MIEKGFTLVELAIVIVIIGILAAVAIPKFSDMTGTARKAVAQNLLSSMQSALAIYVAQQSSIPTTPYQLYCFYGHPTGGQVLSLHNVRGQWDNVATSTFYGYGPDQPWAVQKINFKGGGVGTYYFTGSEVTATYTNF